MEPLFHTNTKVYFRLIHRDVISCLFIYSPASWNCSSENPGRYRGSSDDALHIPTASSQGSHFLDEAGFMNPLNKIHKYTNLIL